MLLARKGYKTLLLDRATFPSNTISTHLIHPHGVAALKKWGVLDQVVATGCPAIHTYAFDMGPLTITGAPGTEDSTVSYGPRRTVLDKILVDAASGAGVEVREGFTVEEILIDGDRVTGISGHRRGGQSITERARVVVGADGIHSVVSRAVVPEQYHAKPKLQASYYTYWSGLPLDGHFEAYDRGDRAWAAWPTNDGLTLVIVGWPIAQFESNRTDIEGHYLASFERAPAFRDRIREATREEPFMGAAVPNYFRKPHGPGWALVGDAGYNRDFITAQGISDAFRDAELCAAALDRALSGGCAFDVAMDAYQSTRDAQALPRYEFTCQFASFTPPPPSTRQLFAAIQGNQDAMDGFVRAFAGVTSPVDYFSDENVQRIFASAG
jgi:2-polyprenyl-6-methoxyphenol hydroxylase-like FAD-dependent oxidoreductase